MESVRCPVRDDTLWHEPDIYTVLMFGRKPKSNTKATRKWRNHASHSRRDDSTHTRMGERRQ